MFDLGLRMRPDLEIEQDPFRFPEVGDQAVAAGHSFLLWSCSSDQVRLGPLKLASVELSRYAKVSSKIRARFSEKRRRE